MNILILDYLPQVFISLSVIYFSFKMLRWAERDKYMCLVYGLIACLGVWAFFTAQTQVEALHLYDQAVALSVDCADYIDLEDSQSITVEE